MFANIQDYFYTDWGSCLKTRLTNKKVTVPSTTTTKGQKNATFAVTLINKNQTSSIFKDSALTHFRILFVIL